MLRPKKSTQLKFNTFVPFLKQHYEYSYSQQFTHHLFKIHGADEGLVVGQVLVDGDAGVLWRGSDEDEAAAVGDLLGHRLGPFPRIVVGLGREPGLRVQCKVDLAHGAVAL